MRMLQRGMSFRARASSHRRSSYLGSSYRWVFVVATMCALSAASCNNRPVRFTEVEVTGLPCATPGDMLTRPLLIVAEHNHGTLRQTYNGRGLVPRPFTVSLQQDTVVSLRVRLALCRSATDIAACEREGNWLGPAQAMQVDTAVAHPTLPLTVTGNFVCMKQVP